MYQQFYITIVFVLLWIDVQWYVTHEICSSLVVYFQFNKGYYITPPPKKKKKKKKLKYL